ncbi:hypothetical protein NDU88_000670 [Pleurodeles waltl]|uniref:Uncharacterized protein n=1 Tax=Pleurodeles waltl TaxID=8319 RepID=A0AAV7USF3_PLEWA|nr:hypothetical protein NDU88_000670 [Pleurodeles waltl]
MIFTVCIADSENREGCNCTRHTPATPPAPFGAGLCVAGPFPLGRRALPWRAPAGPAGKSEWPPRSSDRGAAIRRFLPGERRPPPTRVRMTLKVPTCRFWPLAQPAPRETYQTCAFLKTRDLGESKMG